jgi:hypothetical protein
MSIVRTYSGVTFELSGSNQARLDQYLTTLSGNPQWQLQLDFMVSMGRTNVLISDNPLDMPAGLRGSMYNQLYNNPLAGEAGGLTTEPGGSNSAFILLNNATITRVNPTSGEVETRTDFTILVHEVCHVGHTGTASHPEDWQDAVNDILGDFPSLSPNNDANCAEAPYRPTFDHSTNPRPVLDTVPPQNTDITIRRDEPSQESDILTDNDQLVRINETGGILEQRTHQQSGGFDDINYNPTDTHSWDTHTVATDATGHVTADVYDYSQTMGTFLAGAHDPGTLHIADLNEAAAAQLTIQMEREYFDGGAVGDHTPTPSVYNADVFNSGYTVFTTGAYNIDFGVVDTDPLTPGTTVGLVDISGTSGIDLSSADNAYDTWTYGTTTDPTTGTTTTIDTTITTVETDTDSREWEPIVLDLNGDGTDIIGRNDSAVYFNLDSDAYLERTA